jgi:uncharacterized protein (TIGR03437 family)
VDVVGGASPTSSATITTGITGISSSVAPVFGVTLVTPPSVTVNGVVNAGSYQTTIAPGSYASIFGANLMDPTFLNDPNGVGDLNTFSRMPMVLDWVTVSFDAPATGSLPAISVPGYVFFVSPGQVNIYVPWELTGYSTAKMKVTFLGYLYSNVVDVAIANYTPAFLMNSGTVADAIDNTTGALITSANPATANEVLQLYANGLGPVTNQPASGLPAQFSPNLSSTTTPVTVFIGGKQANVIYAILAPPYVGEYQVAVTVPTGLSAGPQPITISVGGKTSPTSVAGSTIVIPVK